MNGTSRTLLVAPVLALALAGCGAPAPDGGGPATGSAATAGSQQQELFPDVVDAEITPAGDGTFQVAATVSSPYDSPERYADAIRVRTEDGEVLGVRDLLHDHAAEQPFTRSVSDVTVPDGVREVVVEGRDMVSGWGGATATVQVPAAG